MRTAATLTLGMLLTLAVAAEAAELRVVSAAGFPVVKDLGAQFEQATGHKIATKFVAGPAVKREVDAGEVFDVAISTRAVIDELIKMGKIAADTRADLARAGIGVGIRAGVPKPDISSVEGLKRALLNARLVAYSSEGTSGVYFAGLLERLGIAAAMKPKLRPMRAGGAAETILKGQAELVVVVIPAIMVPGVELVGPLPAELQTYIDFSAGAAMAANEPEVAKAFINLLKSESVASVIKTKGLEPTDPTPTTGSK
jgi:molybdate transport system substrate-binding protein